MKTIGSYAAAGLLLLAFASCESGVSNGTGRRVAAETAVPVGEGSVAVPGFGAIVFGRNNVRPETIGDRP